MDEVIKVPFVPFIFGDARFRVLYGPPNDRNTREVVGVIREDMVLQLQSLLEKVEE